MRSGECTKNGTTAFTETDACGAGALAPAAQDHRIAILEKRARLAVRELHRLATAHAQLQQAALLPSHRARLRAGSHQVARPQVAASLSVVGDHLRERPVAMPEIAAREAHQRIA